MVEGQFKADFVENVKLKDGSLPQNRGVGWAELIAM